MWASTTQPLYQTAKRSRLLSYDEIPTWQKDNEYLLSGYRPASGSLYISFKSLLLWHSETINIHSHTLGSLLFALLPLHFYLTLYPTVEAAEPIDAILFTIYFLGVSVCFACSASCHIIWNHSPPVAAFGNQLDFCGIVLLMWGASLPSIHFGFICQPWLRSLHWLLISLIACGCILFTLYPTFIKPTFRVYRAMMYASLGLFAVIFVMHGLYLYDFTVQRKRFALEWMLLMASLNIAGAAFYALRFPEKWYPYRFDFVGASHQIFHLLVLAAGLIHYKALANAFLEVRGDAHLC